MTRTERAKGFAFAALILATGLVIGACLLGGCVTCGEYTIGMGVTTITLGPGDDKCASVKLDDPLLKAIAGLIHEPKRGPEDSPGDSEPPSAEPGPSGPDGASNGEEAAEEETATESAAPG